MSDTTTSPALGETLAPAAPATEPGRRPWLKWGLLLAALVVAMAMPLYLEPFWLRLGFAAFGAIIGAIGLNLLVGTTGQLSLAHAFFLAVGAITYVYASGKPGGSATPYDGLQLPPLVGGLVIGIAETMAAGYQEQLLFLGRGFGDVVPYVVMILVLLVRPSGLFGTKELTRV